MRLKPLPYTSPTRGLRELTLFFPPDRLVIYRLNQQGMQLVRVLNGVARQSAKGSKCGSNLK